MRQLKVIPNQSVTMGVIGRVTTLDLRHVMAGDIATYDILANIKMTPFVRPMTIDPRVDICTFYVPHRHIYGQDWVDFIQEGEDETINFPTVSGAGANGWGNSRAIPWVHAGTMPLWQIQGYTRIWNRYFRPPRAGIAERDETYAIPANTHEIFGFQAANLPALWNIGHDTVGFPSNNSITVAGSFTLTDLVAKSAAWENSLQREWSAHYYKDLMKDFGGRASIDADERPEFLAQTTRFTSGFDVFNTTGQSQGQAVGRAELQVQHKVPRKLYPEHGTLWTVMCVRFPPIHRSERDYLAGKSQPGYAEITNDPDVVEKQEPVELQFDDLFRNGLAVSAGKVPFGQWWDYAASYVNEWTDIAAKYPIHLTTPTTLEEAVLPDTLQWETIFSSSAYKHWQVASNNVMRVRRMGKPVGRSAFAGANIGG